MSIEPTYCEYITHFGSRNPDSPNFGPDEYCDEEAVPEGDFCPVHIEEEWA